MCENEMVAYIVYSWRNDVRGLCKRGLWGRQHTSIAWKKANFLVRDESIELCQTSMLGCGMCVACWMAGRLEMLGSAAIFSRARSISSSIHTYARARTHTYIRCHEYSATSLLHTLGRIEWRACTACRRRWDPASERRMDCQRWSKMEAANVNLTQRGYTHFSLTFTHSGFAVKNWILIYEEQFNIAKISAWGDCTINSDIVNNFNLLDLLNWKAIPTI